MTEFQSRRERREAEARAAESTFADSQQAQGESQGDAAAAAVLEQAVVPPAEPKAITVEPTPVNAAQEGIEAALGRPLTRREMRLAQEGAADVAPTTTERAVVNPPPSKSLIESLAAETEAEATAAPAVEAAETPANTSATDASAPFTGSNLLSEPKTQSIVLTQVPEAVALPAHTGEITTTGSITILSDSSEKVLTGSLDGADLDRAAAADAVTGAMSVVSPVSALAVIKSRESVAVVPSRALRRGWWQPWLVAIAGLAMLAATIYTTIIILSAIGG